MDQHTAGSKNPIQKLEDFLTLYLVKKAPYTIPSSAREKIVTFVPWIDLILAITFIPILVGLLGLSFLISSFAWSMGAYTHGWGLLTIISLASCALEVFALPGLFKRKKYAWNFVYYAALLGIASNVIYFSVGGILGGIIGLYILFQVKEYYK
jgi:hypothetical protein